MRPIQPKMDIKGWFYGIYKRVMGKVKGGTADRQTKTI